MRKEWSGMSNLPKFLVLELLLTFIVLVGGEVLKKIFLHKNKEIKSV